MASNSTEVRPTPTRSRKGLLADGGRGAALERAWSTRVRRLLHLSSLSARAAVRRAGELVPLADAGHRRQAFGAIGTAQWMMPIHARMTTTTTITTIQPITPIVAG
jgi:hypothetical protein